MELLLQPLDRQVIVITGASSGIGLATAIAAAECGACVVLAARSVATLERIADSIAQHGGQAHPMRVDVTRREDLERLGEEALRRFGRIDTWVNNAGVSIYGRLREVDEADARRLFDVNVWGVVNGSAVALEHLLPVGGALINLGSAASDAPLPLQGHYSASKHAVKGFTDTLRVELADEGAPVSVTLIQPTAVDTPYPEHARSYLSAEPKLPTPMILAERVADAILAAATEPQRELKVGAMARVNSFTARVAPRLADWMSRMQTGSQQRDEAPRDPLGSLYRAGEDTLAGAGRIRGRGDEAAPDDDARLAIVEDDRARAWAADRGEGRRAPAGAPRRDPGV